ncbi:MAG: glycoside hydrolase family 57 protein, partial [Candidatus Margulisiibacteriota bacterium]
MRTKLSVAFVWHMHQPFYKDLVTGEYMLPWVRLHAIKDYYDMAAYLDDFPTIRSTYNVVPSLLTQIEDYADGTARDKYLELSLRFPQDLSSDEKIFILKNFFMANWNTMIQPYPRYADLLLKRGRFVTLEDIADVSKRFSNREIFDLQVWFNLAWFGAIYKEKDETIKGLIQKGKNFTEEDKKNLIEKQMEVMRLVIPKYKNMQEKGQIEISVTPFYHPILPLLCDTESAREALPGIILPRKSFKHPEDAKHQIETAVEYYEKKFGIKPAGMWPSEGCVSEDIIPLVAGAGIKWMATDEQVLAASLSRRPSASELSSPFAVKKDSKELSIIFRDQRLSDDLGFVYAKWNPADAAADIVGKLRGIADMLENDNRRHMVSIILDGENAWEYYRDNAKQFFSSIYGMTAADPALETVRVKDFIEQNKPFDKLHRLFPGSWINHNFAVWIGHAEDNKAWDYLSDARAALLESKNAPKEAYDELYIAEGSDWNWWYGDDHSCDNDEDFDLLFRKHIMNIYKLIGRDHPMQLETPIKAAKSVKPTREPVYLIGPKIDGEVTNYYEWLSAGLYSIDAVRGAMHQSETIVKNIYYGF